MGVREDVVNDLVGRLALVQDAETIDITLSTSHAAQIAQHLKTHRNSHIDILTALAGALRSRTTVRVLRISGPDMMTLVVNIPEPLPPIVETITQPPPPRPWER